MGEKAAAEVASEIFVIGRRFDTAVAKDWAGHFIIDMAHSEWSIGANDAVVKAVIEAKQMVYVASPLIEKNLYDFALARPTVFARELAQFAKAGYKRVGDYLVPPAP